MLQRQYACLGMELRPEGITPTIPLLPRGVRIKFSPKAIRSLLKKSIKSEIGPRKAS